MYGSALHTGHCGGGEYCVGVIYVEWYGVCNFVVIRVLRTISGMVHPFVTILHRLIYVN